MYLVTVRHSERGKKTRQTEEEVGRQHQEVDRPGVRRVPEGIGEQSNVGETCCEVICGAPMIPVVWEKMMVEVKLRQTRELVHLWCWSLH